MNEREETIKCLDQFIETLHNSVDKGAFCFRGQVNHSWEAIPSIFRGRNKLQILHLQAALLRDYLLRPKTLPFLRNQDPIEYWMLLQHFGIPTKLLDVSMDPLIALFFACYDPSDEYADVDGKVYMFNLEQYNRLKINTPDLDVYKKGITVENHQELLIKRIENNEHLFFEPLIKNPRMRIQDGAFFLCTTCTKEESDDVCLSMEAFHGALNNYRKSQNNTNLLWFAHRLTGKEYKKKILRELDIKFGINKSMVEVDNDLIRSVEKFYRELHERSIRYYESSLKKKFDKPLEKEKKI